MTSRTCKTWHQKVTANILRPRALQGLPEGICEGKFIDKESLRMDKRDAEVSENIKTQTNGKYLIWYEEA